MAAKKDFTKADGAVDKLFAPRHTQDTQHTQHMYDTQHTQHTYDTQHTQHTYDTHTNNARGKRAGRFGLLLDEKLKEDLKHLSMAKGSKSINDFIVTVLLEYTEREENQARLEQYRKLLQG